MKEAIVKRVIISDQPGAGNSPKVRTLEIVCPYCGKTHNHGGGETDQDIQQFSGHRMAHCNVKGSDDGYNVIIPEGVKVEHLQCKREQMR